MIVYVVHFTIDVAASLVTLFAYRYCNHFWHRAIIWLVGSLFVTVVTVNAVG